MSVFEEITNSLEQAIAYEKAELNLKSGLREEKKDPRYKYFFRE